MSVAIEKLADISLPLLNRFYKECRYSAKAGRGERVYVLKRPSIVAAVRVVAKPLSPAQQQQILDLGLGTGQEGEIYFLRSMCVAPALRGQGLGRQLLQGLEAELAGQLVYCYPFQHLLNFYAEIGFSAQQEEQMPDFVVQAYRRYRQQGRDIALMWRGVSFSNY